LELIKTMNKLMTHRFLVLLKIFFVKNCFTFHYHSVKNHPHLVDARTTWSETDSIHIWFFLGHYRRKANAVVDYLCIN